MKRYAVYTITVNSIVDVSKNVKAETPIEFVQVDGFKITQKDKEYFEKKLRPRIQPNQYLSYDLVEEKAHWLKDDLKPLCGTRKKVLRASKLQDVKGYVNCEKCLKKLNE